MVGLRDAEAFRSKSIELQGIVLDAFEKAIEARSAHAEQADRIRALEAEVANLKTWDAEKKKYELKPNYMGAVAYMLKLDARDNEPPYWLCPNCFTKGQKSYLLPNGKGTSHLHCMYACYECGSEALMYDKPKWDDEGQNS